MRRLALIASLLVLPWAVVVAAPSDVLAFNPFQGACENGGGESTACQGTTEDPIAGPNGAIVAVTSILALIAGVVSVIFLVIGGMKYVTSNGDSSAVSSAKNTIIAALIGLVVAALARPIIVFVVSKL